MKKNSILFLLITLLLSVSMLAGCGGESTTDPTQAPSATKAPADPTDAPADPTDAPADPTDAPADPTDAPADPTAAPADPTAAPDDKITTVYVDQKDGSDDNKGTQDAPVASMEKAYALLTEGGTIKLAGTYYFEYDPDLVDGSAYVITFPETNGKVTITSADAKKLSTIAFEIGGKTTVQFISPVEFDNIIWEYDHDKYNTGKQGNMNIYSGPELVFGENVHLDCINDTCPSKPVHENCIAIRGGWHTPEYKGSIYTGDDIIITVMSGKFAYINGGNADGNTPVGNSVITIGGEAELYQRLQAAGSNGGDVTGNVTINITGGDVGSGGSETDGSKLMQYGIVIVGHGKNGNVAEIGGDVTINITGGYVNGIHTTRTEFEALKGNLTITISEDAVLGENMNITSTGIDLEKTQTLTLPEDADPSIFGDIWDEIKQ